MLTATNRHGRTSKHGQHYAWISEICNKRINSGSPVSNYSSAEDTGAGAIKYGKKQDRQYKNE